MSLLSRLVTLRRKSYIDRYCAVTIDGHPLLREMLDIQDDQGLVIGLRTELPSVDATVSNGDIKSRTKSPSGTTDYEDQASTFIKAENNELDITGTPLECPFDLNDVTLTNANVGNSSVTSAESNSGYQCSSPIADACAFMNVVRDFLEAQNDSSDQAVLKHVVLQCDGGDRAGTLLLGFQKDPAITGLRRFRVMCNGDVVSTENLEKFENIKREHLWGIPHNVVETEARAVYRILDRTNNDGASSIELVCNWTNIKQVLEAPNSDAVCSIVFDVFMGDVRSPAHKKFSELSILEGLAKGLRTNEVEWTSVESKTSVNMDVAELLDSMRIDTGRPKLRSVSETTKPKSSVDDVTTMETFTMLRMRNMDFTDKLWSILKYCGNYSDLIDSFNIVLGTIKSGEIKPVIFTSNHTSFSEMVLDIIRRKTSVIDRRMSGMDALRALVELGIEKLKQDYACILLGSNLVTRENLNSFFGFDNNNKNQRQPNTNNDSADWERNLFALRKIHCVVELVALCHTFADESHTLLGNYARIALDKLASIQTVQQSHSFTFGINWKVMNTILERLGLFPLVWQVRLMSRYNSSFTRTAYRFSVSHPLDVIGAAGIKQEQQQPNDTSCEKSPNEDRATGGPLFHVCVAILVQDSF